MKESTKILIAVTYILVMMFLAAMLANAQTNETRQENAYSFVTDDTIDLRKLNARFWWKLNYAEKLCFIRGYILGATATEAWLERIQDEDDLTWTAWMSLYNIKDKKLIKVITYFYDNFDPSIPIVVPIYKYLQEVKYAE